MRLNVYFSVHTVSKNLNASNKVLTNTENIAVLVRHDHLTDLYFTTNTVVVKFDFYILCHIFALL